MDRATADYMGMLATVINALALQDALERMGVDDPRHVGDRDAAGRRAVHPPPRHAPPREGPRRDLRGRHRQPVLHHRHGGGLRAIEIGAEVILKATKVDGVYDADPKLHADAKRFHELSYIEVLNRQGLKVMDATAISLCMDNSLPIVVFNLHAARQHQARGVRRSRSARIVH